MEKLAAEKTNMIAAASDDMLDSKKTITSCDQVRRQVEQEQ